MATAAEVRVVYRPGSFAPECNCARLVRRPKFTGALVAGTPGNKTVFPASRADGTMVVWHRPDCPEGWF